jgi:hypothetical protein
LFPLGRRQSETVLYPWREQRNSASFAGGACTNGHLPGKALFWTRGASWEKEHDGE